MRVIQLQDNRGIHQKVTDEIHMLVQTETGPCVYDVVTNWACVAEVTQICRQ